MRRRKKKFASPVCVGAKSIFNPARSLCAPRESAIIKNVAIFVINDSNFSRGRKKEVAIKITPPG
jgi:hypothetical protein